MATTPEPGPKRSLPKACWDGLFQFFNLGSFGEYIWKEWRAVKKYPGFLVLAAVITALVTWYAARHWTFSMSYHGPTGASLYFAGDGSEPVAVAKANLYRLSHFQASMQATMPKDAENVLRADVRFWQVNLVFDKEIDADNSVLSVSGLTKESHIEVKDFNTFVAITPATSDIANLPFQPKGLLEIVVVKRTTDKPR